MKARLLLGAVFLVLCGCGSGVKDADIGVELQSPSYRFILRAYDSGKPGEPHVVKLKLFDAGGKELSSLSTPFRVDKKWLIQWVPREDVFVVQTESSTMVVGIVGDSRMEIMMDPPDKYYVIGLGLMKKMISKQ